jgi:hypothetical protein
MYMILQILSGFTENQTFPAGRQTGSSIPRHPKANRRLSILGQYLREVNYYLRSVT